MSGERRATIAAGALVVIAGFASVLSSILGVRLLDEGYILYSSWLLTLGRVPYRDFWLLYPPGMFAMLAALFRVLGPWALVGRATVLASAAVVGWSTYRLSAPAMGRPKALVTTAIVLAWGVPAYNTPFPNWYALALLSVAGVLVVWAAECDGAPRVRLLFFAGMLVGSSASVKQSIGLLALVVFGVVIMSLPGSGGWSRRFRSAAAYVAGAAVPVLVISAALAVTGAADAAVADILVFPFTHEADVVRSLPRLSYAGIFILAVLLASTAYAVSSRFRSLVRRMPRSVLVGGAAVAAVGAAIVFLVHRPGGGPLELLSGAAWGVAFYGLPLVAAAVASLARSADPRSRVTLAVLSAVGLVMFFERGGALDWSHLVYVVPSAVTLLAIALSLGAGRQSPPWILRLGVVLCAAVMFSGPLAPHVPEYGALLTGRLVSLPGAYRGIFTSAGEAAELADVSGALAAAPGGAPVYVYPVDAGLYFMALRPGAGRFAQFVYRLSDSETAEESSLVTASHPGVIVVRIPETGETIGFARWSENGRRVRDSALIGSRLMRRTSNFEIYGGGV